MKRVIAAVFLVAFASAIACAGTTGCVLGTVFDEDGKPLAGVAVSVTSNAASCTVQTDANGEFRCLSMPPGTYLATLQRERYDPAAVAGIPVAADQTLRLRFEMTQARATVTDRCERCFAVPRGFGGAVTIDLTVVDRHSFPNFDDRLVRIGELLKIVPGLVTVP